MPPAIQTQVIEGVNADESLIVMSDAEGNSYVLVKGQYDNIVVAMGEEGWQDLAGVAIEQSIRASVPEAYANGEPLVSAIVRKALDDRKMLPVDLARKLRVDAGGIRQIVEGYAVPEEFTRSLAKAIDVSFLTIDVAWQMDRDRNPEQPVAEFAFGNLGDRVRIKSAGQRRRERRHAGNW